MARDEEMREVFSPFEEEHYLRGTFERQADEHLIVQSRRIRGRRY